MEEFREKRLGGEYIVKANSLIWNINRKISTIYTRLSDLSIDQQNIDSAREYLRGMP